MKKPTLIGVTEYTNETDWKGEHNLPVIPDNVVAKAEVLLLCTRIDEDRLPPPDGDFDVEVTCKCGQKLLKRNSAPTHAVALCEICWTEEMYS